MKGNRQLNDFTPEWETSCPSLRGLWAERAAQKPGSLYSRCYWPAWGPWTSYVTSLSLSFVMSPTCNKYLLAPREVFDLLRENYIEWNMFAINYPIFSFLIMSVSHGGDLLFLLHLDVPLRNQGGKESYWFSLAFSSHSLSGGSSAPFIPCPLFLWGSHSHCKLPQWYPRPPKVEFWISKTCSCIIACWNTQ